MKCNNIVTEGQPIPAFPIPLHQSEPEPLVDLQPLLHQVYDRVRFELAIDYQRPPIPNPSNEDWDWMRSLSDRPQQ